MEENHRHRVRELVEKDRFDEFGRVRMRNEVYRYHDLPTNHFYASTRLISKRREKSRGKYIQKYDKPQTPYQRLLVTLNAESKRYKKLVEQHARFNPVERGRKVEEGLRKLYGYMRQVKGQRGNLIFDLVTDQNLAKAD